MRKIVMTALITFAITAMLFARVSAPIATESVSAQATTAKADLITNIRTDATNLLTARASYRKHRARYDALGFSWVDGDFTGANAGITASQFTSAVTNLGLIFDAYDSGGTLSSGFPTTIERVAN